MGGLGWGMGEWMPYLTGGYATAKFLEKISIKAAPNNPFEDSHQHSGWYIGGGVDMALSHGWMVGLAYRHQKLDHSATYAPSRIAGGAIDPLIGARNDADVSVDTITLRVSWKFDRP